MTGDLRSSYDEVPYPSRPQRQTHPDHLATIALLFGFAATNIERCRVLEIGCATGGNLIPMAASYPASEFVGIDLSPAQIREGAADVEALGLRNIRLNAMDVMDFEASFGAFDYIIAHGVYSWVPPAVQDRILALCAAQLTPSGIAIVSYNTLPGWRMLTIIRDAMLQQTTGIADAKTRVARARATLEFLSDSVQGDDSAYGRLLRVAAENLRQKDDYYILHEYLEEVNEPIYFREFIARAERHRLRYLGEADLKIMLTTGLSAATAQTLNRIAPDLLGREQMLDFMRNRTFRQTMLIRDGPPLDRRVSPERVKSLWISAPLRSSGPASDIRSDNAVEFLLPDGRGLEARYPICKAALAILAERWPLAVSFEKLFAEAEGVLGESPRDDARERDVLATEIMRCFLAEALELHFGPSPLVLAPGQHPEACAVARLHASRNAHAANRRHELVALDDSIRALLPLLDGKRSRTEIAALRWPEMPADKREARLAHEIAVVGRAGLLVG